MTEADIRVSNSLGLHARAAARFVHVANKFSSRIVVTKDARRVDGKSILGLLTLAASKGTKLHLIVEGADEREAIRQLTELAASGFGEVR